MTEVIRKRICDVCKKEVDSFAGSLSLKYSERDYTGCGCPAGIEYRDICLDCCRKLDKAIEEVSNDSKGDAK